VSLGQHLRAARGEVDEAPPFVPRVGEPFDKAVGLEGDQHLVGGLRTVHAVEGKVRPGRAWLHLDEPQDPEPGRGDPKRMQRVFQRQPQCVLGLPEEVSQPAVRAPKPFAKHLPIAWIEQQFKAMGRRDARDLAFALLASYEGIALLTNTFRDPELMIREGCRLERWTDSLARDSKVAPAG